MAQEDIFRAYDVRGRVPDDLDAETMREIGRAFAAGVWERGEDAVLVGHDVRTHSPELHEALVNGIRGRGVDVLDAGMVPYGAVLFNGWNRGIASAYVTASHLAKEWNGVKFAHTNGVGYAQEENEAVKDRFFARNTGAGGTGHRQPGGMEAAEVLEPYRAHLLEHVALDGVEVLMDCGNGAASVAAPDIFEAAGAAVEAFHAEPDGTFPNRSSDVTDETLETLRDRMEQEAHDIGVAYDGDADRVGVVDDTGRLLTADELAAVLLQRILPETEGPVVANVECSRMIEDVAAAHGRAVKRVRVGHTYLFRAMLEHDACFGVERSGHMGIPSLAPVNDGIAPSLYAAQVVGELDGPLSGAVDGLPDYHRAREAFSVPDAEKFALVDRLTERLQEEYGETDTRDGIRVDMANGWALIRASNTSPKIRLTVEAEDERAFDAIREEFRRLIEAER